MSDDFIVMLIYFALKQHFVEYSSTIFPTAHAERGTFHVLAEDGDFVNMAPNAFFSSYLSRKFLLT